MTSALQMVQMIQDGETTSVALVTAALERIAETDDALKAWVWLDRDGALEQARAMDQLRQSGRALGALHGVPIGLKDIIDTADMPTECGSVALASRQPELDAVLGVAAKSGRGGHSWQNRNNALCIYGSGGNP